MALKVCIAVLAAGQSQRFNGAKLLEVWKGQPLILHALVAAREACPDNVYLITGHDSSAIAEVAGDYANHLIFNSRFEEGIGTSISCAVQTCGGLADAMIILLADQPLITATHVKQIIRVWNSDDARIVASEFSGVLGPPVLFGKGFFKQLDALEGDVGARSILRANAQSVVPVSFEPASIDIDTQADLEALKER